MNDLRKQAIIISLIEKLGEKGSWCGETHIQKSTYFLQELLQVPMEFQFILYKHGPFSFDLRDTLAEMRANMLLELKGRYPYGASYLASDNAAALVRRFSRTVSTYERAIDFVTDKLSRLGVAELERLATALYVVLNEDEEGSWEDKARKITALKPHISFDQARQAIEKVHGLMVEAQNL